MDLEFVESVIIFLLAVHTFHILVHTIATKKSITNDIVLELSGKIDGRKRRSHF